ncbi:MAG: hypothetical protein WD341_15410 [Tistlia sp.]|uniref:Vgb family protein n=1 Tax=Tistlia sp. TaxID=3057121 RepID=UPI0034A24201
MRSNIVSVGALTLVLALSVAFPVEAYEKQVFELPEGARPHDVAPAPDGKVWYTAQHQGALGILDPATGEVRQVPLGEGSRPHGVIQGPTGDAWITDGGQNAIVRYDPDSGRVDVWPLPEETGYTNLNTAAFDSAGLLWFTGQNGVYGSFDPQTEEMRVFEAPRGRGPYGIAATPGGEVWYSSLAGSYIARIEGPGGELELHEPEEKGQGARRVWSDSAGRLWVAQWNTGRLSLYDRAADSWREWPLPGEAPKAYAVYVDERDIVWVSDFGGDAIHAFDPESETFETVPKTQPGANVRQILGREGEVWFPESGADRLFVIQTGR